MFPVYASVHLHVILGAVSLTDYLSLCNASVAFSSFGYNLTGLDRPKPFSATLRLLGLKKQRAHCLETFSFSLD